MTFKSIVGSSIIKHFLPRPVQFALLRKQLTLPSLDQNGLTFKPAETQAEFRGAFKVLHDAYVEFKYIEPEPSGLRVTPYHLLPSTMTLVVKKDMEVIGTISVIRDNPFGLPMDKIFDLSQIRRSSSAIGEISALAIRRDSRGANGAVLHLIMRYLWKFTQEYLNIEHFVCAVNPAMNELWESVYLFQPLTPLNQVGTYDYVNGAPAIGLVVPVAGNFAKWKSLYKSRAATSNLFNFIQKPFNKNEYHYSNPYYSVIRNPMEDATRENFLSDPLTNPLIHLPLAEKIKAFCQMNCGKSLEVDFKNQSMTLKPRSERYDVFCRLIGDHEPLVSDVSASGLKIEPAWIRDKAPDFLSIQIGPGTVTRVRTELQWENNLKGTGHKIIDADPAWENFISYLRKDPSCNQLKKVS